MPILVPIAVRACLVSVAVHFGPTLRDNRFPADLQPPIKIIGNSKMREKINFNKKSENFNLKPHLK